MIFNGNLKEAEVACWMVSCLKWNDGGKKVPGINTKIFPDYSKENILEVNGSMVFIWTNELINHKTALRKGKL